MQLEMESNLPTPSREINRLLGEYGNGKGPLLIFIAGMHGNEPAGVIAVQRVLEMLRQRQPDFHGRFVGLAGNLKALAAGERYIDEDLNRVWLRERVSRMESGQPVTRSHEETEQLELLHQIQHYVGQAHSSRYFIDLHTTSSKSRPFIPFDDTLINRHFVKQIPVAAILGIEEFLPGTLLSYLNELGGVAIGYEAGQHHSTEAIDLHEALILHSLKIAGCITEAMNGSYSKLEKASAGGAAFFEIVHRHEIREGQQFEMNGVISSFARIDKDQVIAYSNQQPVRSPTSGLIFMPLYQKVGNDGYFIIRPVNKAWLQLSKWLRRLRLDRSLARLPGVAFDPIDPKTIVVDRRVARFLALQLFHLLGYRKQVDTNTEFLRFRRREN